MILIAPHVFLAWDRFYALIAYLTVGNCSETIPNLSLPLVVQNTEIPIKSHLKIQGHQDLSVY